MPEDRFQTDADVALPALVRHRAGCGCALHARRRFGAVLAAAGAGVALPALAQDGLQRDVGQTSRFAKFVPADQLESTAGQQYQQMLSEASQQKAGHNAEPSTRDEKLVQVGRAEQTAGRMSPQRHEKHDQ